jgi:MOSC domain-containing protein YiiM
VFWTRPRQAPVEPGVGMVVSVNGNNGGVPKGPIGRSYVRKLGIDGDRQADRRVHGGPFQAVCLHSIEAMERIRADGHQAFPGAYGDNLTLLGLDSADLRGGDRLEIGEPGTGPLLQLTDDATPCSKQARWFVDGRIGRLSVTAYPADIRWYAAVVREGPVAAGDKVRLRRD